MLVFVTGYLSGAMPAASVCDCLRIYDVPDGRGIVPAWKRRYRLHLSLEIFIELLFIYKFILLRLTKYGTMY